MRKLQALILASLLTLSGCAAFGPDQEPVEAPVGPRSTLAYTYAGLTEFATTVEYLREQCNANGGENCVVDNEVAQKVKEGLQEARQYPDRLKALNDVYTASKEASLGTDQVRKVQATLSVIEVILEEVSND